MIFKSTASKLLLAGRALVLILVLVSVASYFLSLILGPVLFFSTADGLKQASRVIHGLSIELFAMAPPVPIHLTISIGALFMGIWIIFVVCMFFAWRSRDGFLTSAQKSLTQSLSFAKTSYLYFMPVIASALLFSTILIEQFQATHGVQTGSLNFPAQTSPYVILVNLAFAPLQEEFAFRMTTIGVPLGIMLVVLFRSDARFSGSFQGRIWKRIRLVLIALVSPQRAKAEVGYKNVVSNGFFRGISGLEWVLILFTSLVFGAAHYLLGGGWELGKISTAFLAGFMLAIVFVTYGAYASILLHWFFNYYFTVLSMADSTYSGLFTPLVNLVELINYSAGLVIVTVFLIFAALKVADYLTSTAAHVPTIQEARCSSCGGFVPQGSKYCPSCGVTQINQRD